jgi:hypothetical protein
LFVASLVGHVERAVKREINEGVVAPNYVVVRC